MRKDCNAFRRVEFLILPSDGIGKPVVSILYVVAKNEHERKEYVQ